MQRNREKVIRIDGKRDSSLPDVIPKDIGSNPTTNGTSIPTRANLRNNKTQTKDDQNLVKAEQKIKKLKAQNKKLEQKGKELEQMVEGIPDVDYLRSLIRHLGFQNALKMQELDNEQFSARRDFNKISQLGKELDLLGRASECMKGLEGLIRCISLDDAGYYSDEESDDTHSNSPIKNVSQSRRCSI